MSEFLVEEVVAQRTGAIKIGPFGSSLPRSAMVQDGIKVYGQENLIAGDWDIGNRRVAPETFELLRTCELHPGDVVIGMMGSLGYCEVFPSDAEPGLMDSHLLRIQANHGLVSPEYLRLALLSEETVRQIDRLSHGSIMAGLSSKVVRRVRLSVPPLEEQRRIAEILDTIDETIQATERVIAKYERVIEGVWARASLGRLGSEYQAFAISDFCSLSAGRTAPRGMSAYYGGGVPWVKSGEVAGLVILSTEETVTAKAVHDLGLRIVRAGTPLIAMYGATAGEVGWLGIDAVTNQAVLAVEPDAERADRRWLYWALRLNSGRMLTSIQGSGQPNLSKQIIGAMHMSLPDLEKQLAEVERVDSAQASVEAQRAVAMKLRRTRAALVKDLLSGRVRTVAA